jgi:glycosyltransferase involved in cell wall biosynthesis
MELSKNQNMGVKVLFLVTEDWYFLSHRFHFAKYLADEGYDVTLGCRVSGATKEIEEAGIKVIEIPFAREQVSPLPVLNACMKVRQIIGQLKPDIVHLVALRPILIGWFATVFQKRPIFVNAVTGMGSLFSMKVKGLKLRLTKAVVGMMFRRVFKQPTAHTIWQNHDDYETYTSSGLCPKDRSAVIRGVGIDFSGAQFEPESEQDPLVVLYVGRLLMDKGVYDLVEASKILAKLGIQHKLRIVGDTDECNPRSITSEEIDQWRQLEWIELLGRRKDIGELMLSSNLIVMPSYREGLPQVLLEAGRAGRAVVTTDVPGCREVIHHEETGLLVKSRSSEELAGAMKCLLTNKELRASFAVNNYNTVQKEFSKEVIFEQVCQFYRNVLGN